MEDCGNRKCITVLKDREPLNKKKKDKREEEKRNETTLSCQNESITRHGPFPPNTSPNII